MSFSALETGIAVESLNRAVINSLVRKVISPGAKNRICLELRGPGVNHYLQICVESGFCSLGRIVHKPKAAEVPAAFVMLLRKLCINCAVTKIEQLNGDRVVAITLSRRDNFLMLMCELSGRHANLFLLDEKGVILGSYFPSKTDRRHLVSGEAYQPPADPQPAREPQCRVAAGENADMTLMTHIISAERDADVEARRGEVRRAVAALLKKQQALVKNLQKDQQNAAQAERLKCDAYILQANLHHIKRGTERFNAVDFEGNPVVIALNPKLGAVENMQAMFEKATRLSRATSQIEDRLLNAMLRVEELEALKSDMADLAEDKLAPLLADLETMNRQVVQRARKRGPAPERLPYRQYPIFGAHTARVGKSAKDNDTLTLRYAAPDDLWLHVRGLPGSHVVVPLGRGEDPSQGVLIDAAHLAAHFSSARGDDHVEVIYTRRKYVQKPRGAASGSVRLLREKTFMLKVDSTRLQELLALQK